MKQVAQKAQISLPTLSRIETNKQPVDTDLLLQLSKILKADPMEILGVQAPKEADPLASLVRQIVSLEPDARMTLWKELAKASSGKARTARAKRTIEDVEQLLAQLEFIRTELARVTGSLKRK